MIYQHRLVIARSGRLERRHQAFQDTALKQLDEHGSLLIGAWETWIGEETGSAVWQLRQFDSLAHWEQHQDRVRADRALAEERGSALYPHLDRVDTAIVRMADGIAPLPPGWPSFDEVRGKPRGFIEQRFLHFTPGGAPAHHALYKAELQPALERNGAHLIGLFDTVIGPGTTNGSSHCSIEIRHFPDLGAWNAWRAVQETDPALRELTKSRWLATVERVDSALLKPMDYSRIR